MWMVDAGLTVVGDIDGRPIGRCAHSIGNDGWPVGGVVPVAIAQRYPLSMPMALSVETAKAAIDVISFSYSLVSYIQTFRIFFT